MTIHSAVIQKLLSTNSHAGRGTLAHHFKIFTYGARNGVPIIDSDKTLICLRNACRFIGLLARQKAQFLFVNTNPLHDEIFEQMTKKIGCKYGDGWRLGGFLTNSLSPKKFKSRNKKFSVGPVKLPDCVVIMDTERKSSVIAQADKLGIPVVALADASMPVEIYEKITYPIPANDSVQFVYLFCNLITKTVLLEQKLAAMTENATGGVNAPCSKSNKGEQAEVIQPHLIDDAKHDFRLVSYESLYPLPVDPVKTKMALEKLVVLSYTGSFEKEPLFSIPKSTVDVHNGMSFLDLIINRIGSLNFKYRCKVPLFLINPPETHEFSIKALDKFSEANVDIHSLKLNDHHQLRKFGDCHDANELCQLSQSNYAEVLFYVMNSGILDVFLEQGKEYALLLDSNNMAAVIDAKIIFYLIQHKIDCCMEVVHRVQPHLNDEDDASQKEKFALEEVGQIFNGNATGSSTFIGTTNLWVNLKAIKRLEGGNAFKSWNNTLIKENGGAESFVQETFSGSAMQLFDNAIGVAVPKYHFIPFRTTADLFLIKSELYTFVDGSLARTDARENPLNPVIDFGPEFQKVADFSSRFKSIPHILELDSLKVSGDVSFGSGITLKGNVVIAAEPGIKLDIPDGVVIDNTVIHEVADIFR